MSPQRPALPAAVPDRGGGDGAWPSDVVEVAAVTVEHLVRSYPVELWVVTRAGRDGPVVVAAAGAWAAGAPVGRVLPEAAPPVRAADGARTRAPGPAGDAVEARADVRMLVDGHVVGTVCGLAASGAAVDVLGGATAVAEVLGRALSLALTAARGREVARGLAEVDALTGLCNRRGWDVAMAREEGRCARYGTRAGVVAVDLDRLKTVNDVEGHAAGDALLAATAEVLRGTSRPSDVVARTGGDEFAVLAAEAGPDDLAALAARVCGRLDEAGVEASVAAAAHEPPATMADTWAVADRRMYAVKTARRHRGAVLLPGGDAPWPEVLHFYEAERLVPSVASTGPRARPTLVTWASGLEEDGAAAALAFVGRARRAGLSPAQVRRAVALRHGAPVVGGGLEHLLRAWP